MELKKQDMKKKVLMMMMDISKPFRNIRQIILATFFHVYFRLDSLYLKAFKTFKNLIKKPYKHEEQNANCNYCKGKSSDNTH